VGAFDIKLPPFLTADVDFENTDPRSGWWGGNTYRYFIVLKFGGVEVGRWEWDADTDLAEREEPDEDDVAHFVAEKLTAILFPPNPLEEREM